MSGTVSAIQQWSCTGLLSADETSTECNPFALIILNQPVTRPDILQRLWHTAGVKICADGGGNRVHDTFQSFRVAPEEETRDVRESFLPDIIKGDLDSLRPDVQSYYASKGVRIIKDGDEYSTDLQKCIQHVEEMEQAYSAAGEKMWIPIVILGGLSGRLDQTTSVLSLLHKLRKRTEQSSKNGSSMDSRGRQTSPPTSQTTLVSSTYSAINASHDRSIPGSVTLPTGEELYISYADDGESLEAAGRRVARGVGKRDIKVINDDCIAWALDSGTHEITIDHSLFGQTCGVLPLGVEESRVQTAGLKWDFGKLNIRTRLSSSVAEVITALDWLTSFNTQISTSNHLLPENPSVTVTTTRPVFWTMEIR
ncbi:hypothetical protein QFC24_004571 [Naganishia onofrii]|uniref:Uncharacterized protein n=1 Tax=Naganishia onofrii TaxID=1851511 RepID=A0ACC2XD54_9TREE|nr:hypothetical protein QFC24_004571 [Naganishia onofrii]